MLLYQRSRQAKEPYQIWQSASTAAKRQLERPVAPTSLVIPRADHSLGQISLHSPLSLTEANGAGGVLQRAATSSERAETGEVSPLVEEALRAPGQPLEGGIRDLLEPRFGADLGGVRIHTDAQAAQSAREVNALAYTVGQDIVFGHGQYSPQTQDGQELLAHEITHTFQQATSAPFARGPMAISQPGDTSEREAEQVAEAIVQASPASVPPSTYQNQPAMVQRQADPLDPNSPPGSKPAVDPLDPNAPSHSQAQPATSQAQSNASPQNDCTPEQRAIIEKELKKAAEWTREAIKDTDQIPQPDHTRRALNQYLSTDQRTISLLILPVLQGMLAQFEQGIDKFQCRAEGRHQLLQIGSSSYTVGADNLHIAGILQFVYITNSGFENLTRQQKLGLSDAYIAFIVSNHEPDMLQDLPDPSLKDFSQDQKRVVERDLEEAITWTNQVIADIGQKPRSSQTVNALKRYLSDDEEDIDRIILPALHAILAELQLGPDAFQFLPDEQCRMMSTNGGEQPVALSTYPISLCGTYFGEGSLERTATLIHECAHHAGMKGDTYWHLWSFATLSKDQRLNNADSFAGFVAANRYPTLTTYDAMLRIRTGAGGSIPPGMTPRFVISTEMDVLLAKRLFRFVDLQMNSQVLVDAQGLILGNEEADARVFAPLSLTSVPLFLDLKNGVAYGSESNLVTSFTPFLGPTVGAGAGVMLGRFEAEIDYHYFINLLRQNTNLSLITVSGGIHF